MRKWLKRPFSLLLFFFLFSLFFSLGSACSSIRYTREQLKGADPSKDLAAASLLSQFDHLTAREISILGVRLGDNLKRVCALWGNPSSILGKTYIWKDEEGRYLTRILARKKSSPEPRQKESSSPSIPPFPSLATTRKNPHILKSFVVSRIDLFPTYRSYLHPKNRELFNSKRILSSQWRQRIFGTLGKLKRDGLRFFFFPKRGIQLIVLSHPLHQDGRFSVIFSLIDR